MPEGVAAVVAEEKVPRYFATVVNHDGFKLDPIENDAFFSAITDLQDAIGMSLINAFVSGGVLPSQALVEMLLRA
jgi:hypothetical protein